VDGNKEVQRVISKTERLLLLLERHAINSYNEYFRKTTAPVLSQNIDMDELQSRTCGLGLITYEATSHFRVSAKFNAFFSRYLGAGSDEIGDLSSL